MRVPVETVVCPIRTRPVLRNRTMILYKCLGAYLFGQEYLTLDQLPIISHYLYRRLFRYKGHRGTCAKV